MIKHQLSIIIMLFFTLTASAQWEPTGGPLGGTATAIFSNSGQLFAATDGVGIYTSNNSGSSWTSRKFYNGSAPSQILRLPGGRIVLNNTSSGYTYSNDNGLTWNTEYPAPFTTSNTAYYVFGNIVLRAGSNSTWSTNNIGISLDSGKTWTTRNGLGNFFTGVTVYGFAHIGSSLFLASRNGVYMSSDTGNTWNIRNGASGFLNTNDINYIKSVGSRLFVYNTWGYAYTSTDSGQTWLSIPKKFATVFDYKGYILGTSNGADTLYRFNATTNNWDAHSWQIRRFYGQAFTASGDTLFMAGTNGIYYSLNNGINWTICNGKLNALRPRITAVGNVVLAIDDNGNLYRSDNEGNNWTATGQQFSYGGNSAYTFSVTKSGMVLLSFFNQFYLSADTGRTWKLQSNITINKGGFFVGNKFAYASFDRVYLSNDTGRTATDITSAISSQLANNISFFDEVNGDIWLCSRKQGIFKSTDLGQSWLKYNTGIPAYTGYGSYDTAVYWIAKIGNVLVARVDSSNGLGRHYLSLNNGQNWQYRSADYSTGWAVPYTRNNIVAVDNYLSTDTFRTVTNFSAGIGATPYSYTYQSVSSICGGNNYLFGLYSYFGVWRRPINSIGSLPVAIAVNGIALNQSSIKLSWTPNTNVTRVELQESVNPTSGFGALTSIYYNIATDTLFSRTGMGAGTTRYYRVVSYNEAGQTIGPVVAVSTMARPLEPAVFLATGVSTTQVMLRWQRRETTANKYYIERTPGSTCCLYNLIDSVNATDTAYIVNGLNKNATYYFRIRCADAGGYSNYSANITGKTLDTLPKQPVNLVATATSQYAVNLQWVDSSDNETNFIIQRKDSVTGTFTSIDSVGTNVQFRTVNGLKGNTKYWFRVMAKNTGGYSLFSNTDSAVTYAAPAAPTNLMVSNVSTFNATLSWGDNSSTETGFVIERANNAGGPFYPMDSVGANVTIRNVNNLSASTRYYFRIRTKDVYGYSAYSNVVDTITLPTPPAMATGLFASTISPTAIQINWTDNAVNEEKYYIEMSLSPASGFTIYDSVSANVSNYTANNLLPGTYYYFRIRAYNAGGYSAYTNPTMGITGPAIPKAPSMLAVKIIAPTWLKLEWIDNAGNETRYILQRAIGNGGFATIKMYDAGTTVGYDSSVTSGETYHYRVFASNDGGASAYSNAVQVIPPYPAGNAPQNLTAVVINYHHINLSWTDNSVGIAYYVIERKSGAGNYEVIDSVPSNQKTYEDDVLNPVTDYTYRVRSYVNDAGYSPYSAENSATTGNLPIGLPRAPQALMVVSVANTSITITWADSSDNERKFYIERFKQGIGFELIDSVEQNVTTYTATGLIVNNTYTFRVRAVNSVGFSSYSNAATGNTVNELAAPVGLYATLETTYEVTLNWQDLSGGEDKVIVERSLVSNNNYEVIAELPANSVSYNDVLPTKGTFYYRVRMKKGAQYSGYSNIAVVANIQTGLNTILTDEVSAYPNPFERYLQIASPSPKVKVSVTDVSGKLLHLNMEHDINGNLRIDFGQLPAGVYIVKVNTSHIKVIKQ